MLPRRDKDLRRYLTDQLHTCVLSTHAINARCDSLQAQINALRAPNGLAIHPAPYALGALVSRVVLTVRDESIKLRSVIDSVGVQVSRVVLTVRDESIKLSASVDVLGMQVSKVVLTVRDESIKLPAALNVLGMQASKVVLTVRDESIKLSAVHPVLGFIVTAKLQAK